MGGGNSLKEDSVAVALLFALAAIYFLPVLLKGNEAVLSVEGADAWSQYFHWRELGFASLARGELPLWNPYIYSGTPFVAGIQSAIFYPLNVIFLLFGTAFAINLSIALHCFLASLFTYLFAKYMDLGRAGSFLSAITFAYGAPYFLHIFPGHLSNLSTMVWLPLLFMGVEAFLRSKRMRCAALAGIPLSMQALAGHPQYLFYSAIAVSLYFLLRLLIEREFKEALRCLAGFCLFVVTGFSLSAIQLIPTLELTGYSVRETLSYEWVSIFSFPPENLLTLLLPDFFGNMLEVPYWGKNYLWEMSVYLGVIPLAMIAAAIIFDRSRPVVIFSLIAAAALVLALGKHTPLLRFLYAAVPGFNLFRGLSKFVFVFSFAASMLAGYGLKTVIGMAEEKNPRLRHVAYGFIAVALLSALLGLLGLLSGQEIWGVLAQGYEKGEDDYSPPVSFTDDFFLAAANAAVRNLFTAAIMLFLLGGLLLALAKLKRLSTRLLIVAVAALTVLDLWGFGSRYLATFDPRELYVDRELRALLQADKEPFRIATPLPQLLNAGLLEGAENAGGFDATVLRNYSEFINFTQGLPLAEPNAAKTIDAASPLLNMLNVKYYILEPATNAELPSLSLVLQGLNYKVYRNKDALPRSFIVHQARVIRGRDAILRQMADVEFAPRSYAIVEEKIDGMPNHPTAQSPAPKIVERSLNRVVIEADLEEPGLLVLADSYYPGWKAFVDGKETKIYRMNYVMRGVFMPGGQHRVEFRYDPLSFKVGAIISLTSVVMVAGFLIWLEVNDKRRMRSSVH